MKLIGKLMYLYHLDMIASWHLCLKGKIYINIHMYLGW